MHFDEFEQKQELIELVQSICVALSTPPQQALLLGSWVHGSATVESDFDIRILSENGTINDFATCRGMARASELELDLDCRLVQKHQIIKSRQFQHSVTTGSNQGFAIDLLNGRRFATFEDWRDA